MVTVDVQSKRKCLAEAEHNALTTTGAERLSNATGRLNNDLVALVDCAAASTAQLWHINRTLGGTTGVMLVNAFSGRCLDAAHGKVGRLVYLNTCESSSPNPVGQTWRISVHGTIENMAAKTCVSVLHDDAKLDYYNLTSTVETHWPAVPPNGWLLAVDKADKSVTIDSDSGHSILRWKNPVGNGQKVPAAPDCTILQLPNDGELRQLTINLRLLDLIHL